MCNVDVREKMKKSGIYQWQVAERLSIPETSFCRLLRKELDAEMRKRVMQAIQLLETEKQCEVAG